MNITSRLPKFDNTSYISNFGRPKLNKIDSKCFEFNLVPISDKNKINSGLPKI